ncbi:MAG TPA: hypothetical protein VNH11_23645 [Pirellulales bacterium]|nr:hypothetical protein [Pirellulales bacterium]
MTYVICLALALMAMPYLVSVITWLVKGAPYPLRDSWSLSAAASSGLSLVSAAFAGGSALSGERNDGSARFLAYLPPTRFAIALSKFIVAAGLLVCVWSGNLLAAGVAVSLTPASNGSAPVIAQVPHPALIAAGLMVFGVSWFFSSFMPTTGLPAFIAILVQMIVILIAPVFAIDLNSRQAIAGLAGAEACIGITGIIGGTLVFLWYNELNS